MAGINVLRVVSESALQADERRATMDAEAQAVEDAKSAQQRAHEDLGAYVQTCYEIAKRNRTRHSINERLMHCLRAYNGQYDPDQMAAIRQFGGSAVYARLSTVKCRGATAMLRDVFLTPERVWSLDPTPVPSLPDDITQSVTELVGVEAKALAMSGQPPTEEALADRSKQLVAAAQQAAVRKAKEAAKRAENYLDDILIEGGFYDALNEFLIDLPIFPYAVLKGPVVVNVTEIDWVQGRATIVTKPKLTWRRVSPFDLYFSPGSSFVDDGWTVERQKISRADLNALRNLPGYQEDAIEAVLEEYARGLHVYMDDVDSERAEVERKEDPYVNDAELLDSLEFNGAVRGQLLLDFGFTEEQIPDPIADYYVTCWAIGRHVIKVQINPNPKKRTPYYVVSFDLVPGSVIGNSLIDLISDIQDVANASLRSLVNNMSISSGPQVVVNEERLSPSTNADSLYPWKRWRTISDPLATSSSEKPVEFFQPSSNAAELLGVYDKMNILADEISAIPRYITGSSQAQGGAASTASGLAMLMNNASKVLQNVAASIDRYILAPVLNDLYTMVLLTEPSGVLNGDETVVVKGATKAMQKETDRMRRIEFLQATMNPVDMQIIGAPGRASILRALSEDLGLQGTDVVPSADMIQQQIAAAAQPPPGAAPPPQAIQSAQGQRPPNPSNGPNRLASETDNMHRTVPPTP